MPEQVIIFNPRQISRGPDEIRGQIGSLAFIYSRYDDPDGNRWFVQPGYVGHEEMTNTHGMLRALLGPDAEQVAKQVITVGKVFRKGERGFYVSTGESREDFDWYTIRQLAKRDNLFGRSGKLGGREVVMLWRSVPEWEMMLVEVLRLLEIGRESEAVVTVGNDRQFWARDFLAPDRGGES